jgi:hypothetical protein
MTSPALPSLRTVRGLFLTLLACTLLACTTSERTVFDRQGTEANADFNQLKTYRWDFSALGKLQPDGSHLPEFDRVLCEHVDKHLAEKGYRRIDKGNADFSLDYRVVVTREEAAMAGNGANENEQRANEYGLRWSFDRDEAPSFKGLQAPKDQTVVYQNGTLHLAAFNAQGETIWHSTATRILSGRGNEAERRAALRIAVNKLMDKFPAGNRE